MRRIVDLMDALQRHVRKSKEEKSRLTNLHNPFRIFNYVHSGIRRDTAAHLQRNADQVIRVTSRKCS